MNSTTRLYLRRLLAGDYEHLGEAPPRRPLMELEEIARLALARTGLGLHAHGRLIAAANGLSLLPRRPPSMCGEATRPPIAGRPAVVAYDPLQPAEVVSVLCAHGTAHHLVDATPDPANHADIWLTGCFMLVPRAAAQTLSERELVARSHCPEWLTLATRRLLLAWDSHGHPISCSRYSVRA